MKVKVAGTSVKRKVQRSDLFKRRECGDKEMCIVCGSGGKWGSCRSTWLMYEVRCKKCDRRYIGETARNESTGKVLLRKVRIVCSMYMVWRSMEGACKSETLRWRWLECMEVMQRRGRLRKQWIFNTPREKDWWTGRMSGDRSSCHVSTWACHSEPPWETAGSCDVTTPGARRSARRSWRQRQREISLVKVPTGDATSTQCKSWWIKCVNQGSPKTY